MTRNLPERRPPTVEEIEEAFFYTWLIIRMMVTLVFRVIALPGNLNLTDQLDYQARVLINAFVIGWSVDLILWNILRKEKYTPLAMVVSQSVLLFACVFMC